MTAIAGLRGTGDWGTDERPKNFREMILWRNPNGMAPMFALMAKTKKKTTTDPEYAWWDEPNDIVRLLVNGAVAANSGATTIIVDSADPSATSPDNRWGTAKHLVPGDILLVEPATDVGTFANEYLEVTSVQSDTQFTVTRGVMGSTVAAIADDLYLLKVGNRFAEGTSAPRASSRNPVKYYNYTQIFKNTYEISATAEQTETRTGDPVANDKKRKMFDHSRDIEMALLFGIRSETTDANGKPVRTTGGLRNFIPAANQNVMNGTYTYAALLDFISPVFNWDTPAGNERICFIGNSALNAINKIIAATTGNVVNQQQTVKVYGMELIKLVMPQGTLYLKTHPLLSRHTMYTKSMFIIDPTALIWRPMKNRDTKMMDNVQNKDEDLRRGFWLTEGGLELDYAGLTCGYLGNVVAA